MYDIGKKAVVYIENVNKTVIIELISMSTKQINKGL